ncbi:MAG: hypothetical protein ACOCSF_00885 [Halanaeroarchaeum sp.]
MASRPGRFRFAVAAFVSAASLAAAPTVSAHTGTTHAGTPHWVLLGLVALGLGIVAAGRLAISRQWMATRWGVLVLLFGVVVGGVGAVGLVEIQVVAAVGPSLDHLYPIASLVVGTTVMVASLFVTRWYWPGKPRYAALGALLGAWIVYPVAMPNDGITNPLGYGLVVGLPTLVGYVLWKDAGFVLRSAFDSRFSRTVGVGTGLLTAVIVAFSAGTLTVNPDPGINAPEEAFFQTFPVADPLVTWPAVEFFVPSIPLAGMVSVGTVVLFGVLGGLVGVNAAVVTDQWQSGRDFSLRGSLLGSLTTTGATACCCCAPAMYGVVSALFGTAATPVYWAFMDTSSPLSSSFLAASVLLLTASVVYAASGPVGSSDDLPTDVSL